MFLKVFKKEIKKLLRKYLGLGKKPLGWKVRFDSRSKAFRVNRKNVNADLKSRMWERSLPPLDQGTLGMCTGAACVGLLATDPNSSDGVMDDAIFNKDLAVKIYSRATELDQFDGQYPPNDTGSSVLSAMKAAKEFGLISEYKWCFSLEDVLFALSYLGPVEVGLLWYEGFEYPDRNGLVKIKGKAEGGHAFQLIGIDVEKELVWAVNSWGLDWGKDGRFCFSFADLKKLLDEHGEAVMIIN